MGSSRLAILWPLDGVACHVAQGLPELAASKGAGQAVSLDPARDPILGLRDVAASLHATPAGRGGLPTPRVIVLAGASDESRERLHLLVPMGKALGEFFPGAPVTTFVVLVPPVFAEEEEKRKAAEFFLRLDGLVWKVPTLEAVFVNQLTWPGGSPPVALDPELGELLSRELFDSELTPFIDSLAVQVRSQRLTASSRPCAYATLGAHRLSYPASQAMAHLRARFQRELLTQGLLATGALSEDVLQPIQDHADAFIAGQAREAVKRILALSLAIAETALQGESPNEDLPASLKVDVDAAIAAGLTRLRPFLEECEEAPTDELLNFLPSSPGLLAGAVRFMEALGGARLASRNADDAHDTTRPSGTELFHELACRTPFVGAISDCLEPHIEAALAALGVKAPPRQEGEPTLGWAARSLEVAASRIAAADALRGARAGFCHEVCRLALQHLGATGGEDLLEQLAMVFCRFSARLSELLTRQSEELTDAQRRQAELTARYSWWRRGLGRDPLYLDEKAALDAEVSRIEAKLAATSRETAFLRGLLLDLVNKAVLPDLGCRRIAAHVESGVAKAKTTLRTFVLPITTTIEASWEQSREVLQTDRPTVSTVLGHDKLARLYDELTGRATMGEQAARLLEFLPAIALAPLSYASCRDLKDHLLAGPNSLLDRMSDFASEVTKPVERRDIFDILEMDGRDGPHRVLAAAVERTRAFLAMTDALLPLVETEGKLKQLLVLRVAGGEGSRLLRDHLYLVQPDCAAIDTHDPHTIDVTRLVFGFPAFLIHTLHEAHRTVGGPTAGGKELREG